ncbi:GM16789 [Drosophila sechellia]|uniref:GM16789 n=1 Tax=Drosophila sechellia TaxID=7238 RepID=B4ID49_DROSE|nr:GM16789 [Drosophila sechellia]
MEQLDKMGKQVVRLTDLGFFQSWSNCSHARRPDDKWQQSEKQGNIMGIRNACIKTRSVFVWRLLSVFQHTFTLLKLICTALCGCRSSRWIAIRWISVTCGDKTLISRRAAPVTCAIHLCGGAGAADASCEWRECRCRCRCQMRISVAVASAIRSRAADSNRNVLDASHELFRLSGNSEASGQPSRKKQTRAERPKNGDADANAAGRRWQRQQQQQR